MAAAVDWKKLVGGIAPILGSALGGPLGGVAGSFIADALNLPKGATHTDIAAALTTGQLTGDQIVALRQADDAFKLQMAQQGIDIQKINAATEAAYITDTSDARHTFGADDKVFWLGVIILATFAILVAVVLYGLYGIATGKVTIDPAIMTVCGTLVGTIIGYLAGNAQQVVNYFFGSSKGSKDAATSLQTALTTSMQQVGAAALAPPVPPTLVKMPDGTYASNANQPVDN